MSPRVQLCQQPIKARLHLLQSGPFPGLGSTRFGSLCAYLLTGVPADRHLAGHLPNGAAFYEDLAPDNKSFSSRLFLRAHQGTGTLGIIKEPQRQRVAKQLEVTAPIAPWVALRP